MSENLPVPSVSSNSSSTTIAEPNVPMTTDGIQIRPFQPGDEQAFRQLNEEWIAKSFEIEEADRITLGDPVSKILKPGGHIFFAIANGEPIGCCALIADGAGVFEVAKMAVTERYQGRGIGRKILEYTIGQARALRAQRLYLDSSSKLPNAIHLYESLGFRHLPPERVKPSPYARSDISMEMYL